MDLGLDAALPPVIELGSKIAEFGRGERSRAENSDACQTIRFMRRNEGRSSGSQPGEMSARPLRSSPCRVKAPRGCRWHSNPHRQTRRLSDLAGGATDRSRRGANAVGPSEPGERAEADYRPTLCHGNPSHGAGARELTVSGVPARTGRRDTRFRDCRQGRDPTSSVAGASDSVNGPNRRCKLPRANQPPSTTGPPCQAARSRLSDGDLRLEPAPPWSSGLAVAIARPSRR